MLHKQYYVELEKYNRLLARKNEKTSDYNGIYDRFRDPVLTREHIPLFWKYDLDIHTNPYFMERLGVNAAFNSGAMELNGKYYLVARIEGADRKSFFAVAESDSPVDGFHFWDYPVELPDTCPQETNVYDMRLTKHEDGYIYGVFCSESKDTTVNDLSAAVAAAGIVRTKDLRAWERLANLKTLNSPQQRNVVLHPEFVDGKYAFYTRPMDDFIDMQIDEIRNLFHIFRNHHIYRLCFSLEIYVRTLLIAICRLSQNACCLLRHHLHIGLRQRCIKSHSDIINLNLIILLIRYICHRIPDTETCHKKRGASADSEYHHEKSFLVSHKVPDGNLMQKFHPPPNKCDPFQENTLSAFRRFRSD